MKFIKFSSVIILILLVLYYITSWIIIPKLLPQPPAIAGPVGTMLWANSQSKETQQVMKTTSIALQLIIFTIVIFYVANIVWRIKLHKWDKWFMAITLLYLPALPFTFIAIIITFQTILNKLH